MLNMVTKLAGLIQGGPAKVRPTNIFDGNIECIGKIQWFSAHVNYIQQEVVWCNF